MNLSVNFPSLCRECLSSIRRCTQTSEILLDVFRRDCWANLLEIFRNVSVGFDDNEVIYVMSTYDLRLEISFGISENAGNSKA